MCGRCQIDFARDRKSPVFIFFRPKLDPVLPTLSGHELHFLNAELLILPKINSCLKGDLMIRQMDFRQIHRQIGDLQVDLAFQKSFFWITPDL